MEHSPPRAAAIALAWTIAVAGGCGGSDAPQDTASAPAAPSAAAPATKPSGGGFDLGNLRPDPAPSAAAPPAPAPTEAKPAPTAAAPDGKPAPPAPAPVAPAEDVPLRLADIGDSEVLAAWSADEREALQELSEEERRELMESKRREIFLARGGKIDGSSGRMEDQGVDEATGMRGPARPDVPKGEQPPADLEAILSAIASTDPETRATGAEMATRYADKAAAARFMGPLLKDKDPEVRAIAVSTLGALGRAEGVPRLVELLQKETKDVVRASALRAIAQIGGEEGVAALRTLARDGYEPMDRASSLSMLTDLKDAALVRDLIPAALQDMTAEVRLAAVVAVRTFEMKEYGSDVARMLEDASDAVIVDALRTLGVLKTRSAVGAMVKVLLKPHPDAENPESIQDAAAGALEAITGESYPVATARTDGERLAAIDAWRSWWERNKADWK